MRKELRFTDNIETARAELKEQGGRVLQVFTESAFVAEMPDDAQLIRSGEAIPPDASPETRLAAEAWRRNESKLEADPAPDPTEGLPWDTEGYEPPFQKDVLMEALRDSPFSSDDVQLSTGTPTSLYMVGSVAVGVVIVSGDDPGLDISDDEQIKIIQEVQAGLDWLATVEPRAQVSFVYDIQPVNVSVPSGPLPGVSDPYEAYEQRWRDAALNAMGYGSGRNGYRKYAQDLLHEKQTNWAYVAFFTKYELNHFAYAVWEKVVMHYENDGWGVDNIHKVFAHESCHIFGAADEYGNCKCGGAHGYLGAPNNNCIKCFPPGQQQDCVMAKNTLAMCQWSRQQIGWDTPLFP